LLRHFGNSRSVVVVGVRGFSLLLDFMEALGQNILLLKAYSPAAILSTDTGPSVTGWRRWKPAHPWRASVGGLFLAASKIKIPFVF
jgi:hypothetical protein